MDLPFATLTPANVLAKLAFNDTYEAILQAHQMATTDDIPAVRYIQEIEMILHKPKLETCLEQLDIVASNGAYLVTRPNTPDHNRPRDPEAAIQEFAATLTAKLELVLETQEFRRKKYGDAAFEYLPRHTPPHVMEKYNKEIERLYELWDAPSPPSDSEEAWEREREIVEIMFKPQTKAPKDLPSADRLPTPQPSSLGTNFLRTILPLASCASQSKIPMSASEATTARGKKRRCSDATEGYETRSRNKKARNTAEIP